MASQSSYQSGSMPRSYYSSHASTPAEGGQSYPPSRGMLPPAYLDFPPPRPMEIDLSNGHPNASRTLPSLSMSLPPAWDSGMFTSQPLDLQFATSSLSRLPETTQGSNRSSQQDPLVQWYADPDGPWVGIKAVEDERPPQRQPARRIHFDEQHHRQSTHPVGTPFRYPIPASDSGYGTRQSVGNTSVFSGDIHERDHDNQSLVGQNIVGFQFQGYADHIPLPSQDWTAPQSSCSSPKPARLTCLTCNKTVKTPSELKKHDFRHRKPFVCKIPGCTKSGGFSTTNDLDRHIKSKHPSAVGEVRSMKHWRCLVPGCKSKDKSWPRSDNFRSHLKRVHVGYFTTDEDVDLIVARGEYEDSSVNTSDLAHEESPGDQVVVTKSPDFGPAGSQGNLGWTNPHPNYSSFIPSIGSVLDGAIPRSIQDEQAGLPLQMDSEGQGTVEPTEIFPIREKSNHGVAPAALENHTSDSHFPIDPALLDSPMHSISSAKAGKGLKALEKSAVDATILEAVKTALNTVENVKVAAHDSRIGLGQNDVSAGRRLIHTPLSNNPNQVMAGVVAEGPKGRDRPITSTEENTEAKKNAIALEVLTIISRLGYKFHKESDAPAIEQSLHMSSSNSKAEKRVTCSTCHNFTGRPCELRKHMKRHSKPYGCTFAKCNKIFGSKNDWKRHESSQHFHQETFRCNTERKEGRVCTNVYYRRQTFRDHLKSNHNMTDDTAIKEKLESCRIGKNCQSRFWCGFCVKLVILEKNGLAAWGERFDHIDDHFMGRHKQPTRDIREWIPVNDDKPRGDVDSPEGSSSEKETLTPDRSNFIRDESEIRGRTPAVPETVEGSHQSSKRRRSYDEADSHSARPSKMRRRIRTCCQCGSPNNPRFDDRCNTCANPHPFCEDCQEVQSDPLSGDEY